MFLDFDNFIDHYLQIHHLTWEILFKYVIESERPLHLLLYEDLLKNPIAEIFKIVKFLEQKNGYEVKNLEQRLICLSENLQGTHKRKKTQQHIFPYNKKSKITINAKINYAQKLLDKYGLNINLSFYKKEPE